MPLGSTKASRIKICSSGVVLSLAIMMVPFTLSVALDEDYVVFSFVAWVGLFFAGTFLALLVSQLVKIEAEGRPSGKIMGIEIPFEFRGITVVLLGFYVLLAFFYVATDLEGQLSAKKLRTVIDTLEDAIAEEQEIVKAFNTIHTGNHMGDLNILKLSYHCGSNDQTERITDWNRYDVDSNKEDSGAYSSADEPFPVSDSEYVYRVQYRRETQEQDFSGSPLQVRVNLDRNGVLTARIEIGHPEAYRDLWRYCTPSEDSGANIAYESEYLSVSEKADPNSGG